MASYLQAHIEQIAITLRNASSIAVLTGAGISAESGVPTFREAQSGLWSRFRAEDLATPEAFIRDPKLVWDWYAWRRQRVQAAEPNAGHVALARLQDKAARFRLITQNVDGLHQRAGSGDVIELHGNLLRSKCFDEAIVLADFDESHTPPRCPRCGAHMRPDVVWFGESLPVDALEEAVAAAQSCDVFLSIGTSALVYPAAQLPHAALTNGATVVEINKEATALSPHVQFSIRALAGELMPMVVRAAWPDD